MEIVRLPKLLQPAAEMNARLRVRSGLRIQLEAPAGPEAFSFFLWGYATMRSTLLLLANDPDILIDVANAARDAGYLVAPGRYQEHGISALSRVSAIVALVHADHEAADSLTFAGLARHLGTEVFLFARRGGSAEQRARVASISARSPFPVLEYEDPAELVKLMHERRAPRRAAAPSPYEIA